MNFTISTIWSGLNFVLVGCNGGATSALTFGTISSANSSAYSDSLNFSCA